MSTPVPPPPDPAAPPPRGPVRSELTLLLVLAGIAIALIRTEHPLIIYPIMVLSGLSVFAVLSGVYTVLAIIVLRRENAAAQWWELLLPILLGMTTALLQILVISWLRYALTGTWNPIHL